MHPQQRTSSFTHWQANELRLKIYFQKRFKKACEKRKSFVLLHPLIERLAYKKQEEHVPRHIELTAVPMQIGTNKIRVIESEDLK